MDGVGARRGTNIPYFLKGNCVHKGTKQSPGAVVKCHKTRKQAAAHLRALYKNVPDAHGIRAEIITAAGSPTYGIRFYLREGERSVDFRAIALDAIHVDRAPPFPIMLQTIRPESGGHALSELCGVIKAAGVIDNVFVAEGYLADNEAGHNTYALMMQGVLQTWSPDLGNPFMEEDKKTGIETLTHATFIGATIVPFPAIDSAVVELFDLTTGEVIMPAPVRVGPVVGSLSLGEDKKLVYTFQPVSAATGGGNYNYFTVTTSSMNSEATAAAVTPALTAHADPPAPPSEFFTEPELTKLERYVTVTDDGRIYGHYAGPEDCHIGYLDACVPAPLSASSLSHWSVGTVKTSDGKVIETGPLALRFGHADTVGLSASDAKAHYDDPDSGVADLVVGVHEIPGVGPCGWFSGSVRPGVSPEDVRKVLASGVSGDWRNIGGELRLIGICSVNRPGFAKVSLAASAGGEIEALVAAGGAPIAAPGYAHDCNCDDNITQLTEEVDDLHRLIAESGIEDKAIDNLYASLGPDPDTELDALYARIAT